MKDSTISSVSVRLRCSAGHEHALCVPVERGLPPELRCSARQDTGYGPGGGGCAVPLDLAERVQRALRDSFQEIKRRGYVLIEV